MSLVAAMLAGADSIARLPSGWCLAWCRLLRSGVGVHPLLAGGLFRGSDVVDRGLGEWFPGAVQERLSEQPTRRTKALPGAKYSPDEFTHFPDQPADHDTEGSRA
ncbi:hypothetical protein [Streptomyces sp. NPDC002573]|uniref:hypothetical protein n=1 Tax=Streptomyces sp. NPDC002573 TaxID=3364651 RepID=UPI00368464F6